VIWRGGKSTSRVKGRSGQGRGDAKVKGKGGGDREMGGAGGE